MIGEPLNDRQRRADGDPTGHAAIEPGAGTRRLACERRRRNVPRLGVAICKTQNVLYRIHATHGCMYAKSAQYRRAMGPHRPRCMAYIPRWDGPAKTIARRWRERSSAARWPVRPRRSDCRETRSAACCEATTPDFPGPTPSAGPWASPSRLVPREAAGGLQTLPPSSGFATPFPPRDEAPTRPGNGTRSRFATPDSRSCSRDSPNTGRSSTRRSAIVSRPGSPLSSIFRERAKERASAHRRVARVTTGNRGPARPRQPAHAPRSKCDRIRSSTSTSICFRRSSMSSGIQFSRIRPSCRR